jgi:hypothetical protein
MIKENINKIDFNLKNLFSQVEISEKNRKGDFYFEINATDYVQYLGEKKEATVKVEISKKDLNGNFVKWNYLTNPLNENSDKIERVSLIDNIANDIHEILTKKMMESEYFERLDSLFELINESAATDEQKEELQKKLEDILKRFQVEEKLLDESAVDLDGNKPEKTLVFQKDLKMSERFNLETELKSIGIEYISFSGSTIKIKL